VYQWILKVKKNLLKTYIWSIASEIWTIDKTEEIRLLALRLGVTGGCLELVKQKT
jgi:hypothetical protein